MTKQIDTTADFFLWKVLMSHTAVTKAIRNGEDNISKLGSLVEGARWNFGVALKHHDKTYDVKMVRRTEPAYMVVDVLHGETLWRYDSLKIIEAMPAEDILAAICEQLTDVERAMLVDWILTPLQPGCLAQEYRDKLSITHTVVDGDDQFTIRKADVEYVVRYSLTKNPIHTYRECRVIGSISHLKGILNTGPIRYGISPEDITPSDKLSGEYIAYPDLSSRLEHHPIDSWSHETPLRETPITPIEEPSAMSTDLQDRTPAVPVWESEKVNVSMLSGPFATNPDLADLVSVLITDKALPKQTGIILNPIAKTAKIFSLKYLHDAIQPRDGVLDWKVPSALTNLTVFQLEQVLSIMKTGTPVLVSTRMTPLIGSLTDLVGRTVKRTSLIGLPHDILFDALMWLTTRQYDPVAYNSKACDGGTLQHLVTTTRASRSFSWVYSGPSSPSPIMLKASLLRLHDLGFRAPL